MVDAPGAGAASVATQLLAFYREPARFRPHFLHGDEPLPEGHVVLKFALGRFSPGWHRDLSRHDQQDLIQAARAFVRQVCLWERATHYQVLCLGRTAAHDEVKENYRLLMALLHPDRRDADWPADSAQRVNDAYALLSDDKARRVYDEGLIKSHHSMPFEPVFGSAPHAVTRRRRGFVRPFLAVVAGGAAIFLVQAWWVGDVPKHYTLLERSLPLGGSSQWVRDALPTGLPHFLDSKPSLVFDPLELLAPAKAPPRLASVAVWTPAPPPPPVARMVSGSVVVKDPAFSPREAAPAPRESARGTVREPVREILQPSLKLAQAAGAPAARSAPAVARPTTEEIEMLIARVVSYYEAGDSEGLVGLFDPSELGFWKGIRTRSAYSDFFRSTRQRRLRMDRLSWQAAPQAAQARGQATLTANYAEGSGKLERKVDVEIDIGMRNGEARITRLLLYPEPR